MAASIHSVVSGPPGKRTSGGSVGASARDAVVRGASKPCSIRAMASFVIERWCSAKSRELLIFTQEDYKYKKG